MFEPAAPRGQMQASSQEAASQPVPPLSPTEKRVCALLLQRLTEQRIADHLERSPNTVHVHVRNIYRKLGIRSRKQLHDYPGIANLTTQDG